MEQNDVEYLKLLMQRLKRAYLELDGLKKEMDLKVKEIAQLEQMIRGMSGGEKK